jgi:hypothetical protein
MALETVFGYLITLGLPLWLVVEGIKHMEKSPKQPQERVETAHRSAAPVSGVAASPIRPDASASRQPTVAA